MFHQLIQDVFEERIPITPAEAVSVVVTDCSVCACVGGGGGECDLVFHQLIQDVFEERIPITPAEAVSAVVTDCSLCV